VGGFEIHAQILVAAVNRIAFEMRMGFLQRIVTPGDKAGVASAPLGFHVASEIRDQMLTPR
jgi:hypothetical protein